MKRLALLALCAFLAACQQDEAQDTTALPMTAETTGFFCQMNLLEHPGPKAQIHLEGYPAMPIYFSQVRDGIAFLRLPEKLAPVLKVWVSDMGAPGASWEVPGEANWIAAEDAVYVLNSRREGGMGLAEVVPFGDPARARDFAAEWGGEVVAWDAIPDSVIAAPAEAEDTADGSADADFDARLKALSERKDD